jgi:hypothetical protein
MKNTTTQTIIDEALFNIFGDTTPEQSIQDRAASRLFDILDRLQRRIPFFFNDCSISAITASGVSFLSFTTSVVGATEFNRIGKISRVLIESGNIMVRLRRVGIMDYSELDNSNNSKPIMFAEKYQEDAITEHGIYLYPTPNDVYALKIFYRRIFTPNSWDETTYEHIVLDEMRSYLTAKLTAELAAIRKSMDAYQIWAAMAADELSALITRSNEYRSQDSDWRRDA